MKNPRSFALNVFLFLAIAAAGLWLGLLSRGSKETPRQTSAPPVAPQVVSAGDPNATPLDQSPEAVLSRVFARLRASAPGPGELDAFRRALLAADPARASAAIRAFLATGQDALTGETFAVGKNGELGGAPTFRVLLLDLLGRISKEHGLPDAGVLSRALLEKKTSADEWAIALRNTAWATPEDRAYLTGKARELLNHQPWRMQPTAGFYEAFDVIVYTRDATFIPQLSQFVLGEDEPLKNTAATTLDRLATMAPLDVMSYLNHNPTELADKPYLRSDYYTKADFTQPAQRAAVEAYLDRPDIDTKAKTKVVEALGRPGVFVSENLLTSTPEPAEEIPVPQKNALQQALNDWLRTNRYPSLTNTLMGRQSGL